MQISKRKELTKIKAEVNEIENKQSKNREKPMKPKATSLRRSVQLINL